MGLRSSKIDVVVEVDEAIQAAVVKAATTPTNKNKVWRNTTQMCRHRLANPPHLDHGKGLTCSWTGGMITLTHIAPTNTRCNRLNYMQLSIKAVLLSTLIHSWAYPWPVWVAFCRLLLTPTTVARQGKSRQPIYWVLTIRACAWQTVSCTRLSTSPLFNAYTHHSESLVAIPVQY